MNYKLNDLIDTERLQQLLDHLYDASGIPSGIIGADGEIITQTGWRDICTKYHRANEITNKRCIESDTTIQLNIEAGEKYVVSKCKNGMVDIASPIVINNQHIATIFQGQFFFDSPDLGFYRNLATEVGFKTDDYLDEIRKTPVITEDKIKPIVQFLTELAGFIAELGYTTLKIEKQHHELHEQHEELSAVYEELVATEEELRSNYELITEKSQALESSNDNLLIAHEGYALISEGSYDATWDVDLVNHHSHYSTGITKITKLPYEQVKLQDQFTKLIHPDDKEKVLEKFKYALKHDTDYMDQYRIIDSAGDLKWVMVKGKIKRQNNKAVRVAGSIGDITDRVRAEAVVKEMAYTDRLTDTYNRNQMYLDINKHLEAIASDSSKNLLVMFLDLDNFKNINDIYGHTTGDAILVQVANRLKQHSDSQAELYRFGGDEFVIVTQKDAKEAYELAEIILKDFGLPFMHDYIEHHLTASIGVANYPCDGMIADTLIKNADMAMYEAKGKGKNQFKRFDVSMHETLIQRKQLDEQLSLALYKREFFLTYQPLVDVKSNTVSGLEALIRWQRNDEVVSPGAFIPQAEQSGFIKEIDLFVFETVIKQITSWRNKGITFNYVSVNVSPAFLMDDQLMSKLEGMIRKYSFNPSDIQIEITENILIESFDLAYSIIKTLKMLGFTIALDDFGQGYSSLSYLKSLPIDVLKVDKYFVDGLIDSPDPIIEFIIGMGQRLQMTVVAEGVETIEQLNQLKAFNCDKYQGYLYSKPVTVHEIEKILRIK